MKMIELLLVDLFKVFVSFDESHSTRGCTYGLFICCQMCITLCQTDDILRLYQNFISSYIIIRISDLNKIEIQ